MLCIWPNVAPISLYLSKYICFWHCVTELPSLIDIIWERYKLWAEVDDKYEKGKDKEHHDKDNPWPGPGNTDTDPGQGDAGVSADCAQGDNFYGETGQSK